MLAVRKRRADLHEPAEELRLGNALAAPPQLREQRVQVALVAELGDEPQPARRLVEQHLGEPDDERVLVLGEQLRLERHAIGRARRHAVAVRVREDLLEHEHRTAIGAHEPHVAVAALAQQPDARVLLRRPRREGCGAACQDAYELGRRAGCAGSKRQRTGHAASTTSSPSRHVT
eukprot:6291709-Prymnesium_polylepis.1